MNGKRLVQRLHLILLFHPGLPFLTIAVPGCPRAHLPTTCLEYPLRAMTGTESKLPLDQKAPLKNDPDSPGGTLAENKGYQFLRAVFQCMINSPEVNLPRGPPPQPLHIVYIFI